MDENKPYCPRCGLFTQGIFSSVDQLQKLQKSIYDAGLSPKQFDARFGNLDFTPILAELEERVSGVDLFLTIGKVCVLIVVLGTIGIWLVGFLT